MASLSYLASLNLACLHVVGIDEEEAELETMQRCRLVALFLFFRSQAP